MTSNTIRSQAVAWSAAVMTCWVLFLPSAHAAGGRVVLTGSGDQGEIKDGSRQTLVRHRRHGRRNETTSGRSRSIRGSRGSGNRIRLHATSRHRQRHVPGRPYAGVSPSSDLPPPGPKPPSDRCWLTWPGFQLTKTGSRVFFQLNHKVAHQVRSIRGGVEIFFPGCKIRLRNNLHRLVTSYFPSTPVRDVRTRNRRKGVVARLRLKAAVTPRIRWFTKDGWAYLLVDFGAYVRGSGRTRSNRSTPKRQHLRITTTRPASNEATGGTESR